MHIRFLEIFFYKRQFFIKCFRKFIFLLIFKLKQICHINSFIQIQYMIHVTLKIFSVSIITPHYIYRVHIITLFPLQRNASSNYIVKHRFPLKYRVIRQWFLIGNKWLFYYLGISDIANDLHRLIIICNVSQGIHASMVKSSARSFNWPSIDQTIL